MQFHLGRQNLKKQHICTEFNWLFLLGTLRWDTSSLLRCPTQVLSLEISVMSFEWLSDLQAFKSTAPLTSPQSCGAAACRWTPRCCSEALETVSEILEAPRLQKTSAPLWSESEWTWLTSSRTLLGSVWCSSSAKAVGDQGKWKTNMYTLMFLTAEYTLGSYFKVKSVRAISSPGQAH